MNSEGYEARVKLIKKQCNAELKKLADEYALQKNTVDIGDIVTDWTGTIKVEKIGVYLTMAARPSCFYVGTCCTKRGWPLGWVKRRRVNQDNLK